MVSGSPAPYHLSSALSILEGAGCQLSPALSLGLPLRVPEMGGVGWGEQGSLLKVVQGVVLAIGLEVTGQGLLLLTELGRHLLIHVREEQTGTGFQLLLSLLEGLHHLEDMGQ